MRSDRRRCSQCGLPHSKIITRGDERLCPNCWVAEIVRHEETQIAEVLERMWDDGICAYCGEAAEHIEHVVPRCTGLPTYTVPACAECNLIAGGKPFTRFCDKQEFIKGKLEARYAKVLAMPEWDADELEELGYNMRCDVEAAMKLRGIVLQRLEWDWVGLAIDAGFLPFGKDVFGLPLEGDPEPMVPLSLTTA